MKAEWDESNVYIYVRTGSYSYPAIDNYIHTLDIQLCRRGKGVPTILYVGDVFYKSKRVKIGVKNVQKTAYMVYV